MSTLARVGRALDRFPAAWETWWMRKGPPHLLAILRIGFGGFLLCYFAIELPTVGLRYSEAGLIMPEVGYSHPLGVLFAGPPLWAAMIVFCTFLASIACFTVGYRTRAANSIMFILYMYYWMLSLYQFGTSFERLFILITLVLIGSDCGNTFSVDARRRHGSYLGWTPISILPQRLLAAQITATYLGVGWQKLVLPVWQTGEVLMWGFMGRWATPVADWFIQQNPPIQVFDFLVFTTKAFEVTIPFGLWSKRWRWYFFAMGALFHTMITIVLAIWWFMVLIPAYILFFEPEEVYQFLKKHARGRIP